MQIQKVNNNQSFGMNLKADYDLAIRIKNNELSNKAIQNLAEIKKAVKRLKPIDQDAYVGVEKSNKNNGKIIFTIESTHGSLSYEGKLERTLLDSPKYKNISAIIESENFLSIVKEMAKEVRPTIANLKKITKMANSLL